MPRAPDFFFFFSYLVCNLAESCSLPSYGNCMGEKNSKICWYNIFDGILTFLQSNFHLHKNRDFNFLPFCLVALHLMVMKTAKKICSLQHYNIISQRFLSLSRVYNKEIRESITLVLMVVVQYCDAIRTIFFFLLSVSCLLPSRKKSKYVNLQDKYCDKLKVASHSYYTTNYMYKKLY